MISTLIFCSMCLMVLIIVFFCWRLPHQNRGFWYVKNSASIYWERVFPCSIGVCCDKIHSVCRCQHSLAQGEVWGVLLIRELKEKSKMGCCWCFSQTNTWNCHQCVAKTGLKGWKAELFNQNLNFSSEQLCVLYSCFLVKATFALHKLNFYIKSLNRLPNHRVKAPSPRVLWFLCPNNPCRSSRLLW